MIKVTAKLQSASAAKSNSRDKCNDAYQTSHYRCAIIPPWLSTRVLRALCCWRPRLPVSAKDRQVPVRTEPSLPSSANLHLPLKKNNRIPPIDFTIAGTIHIIISFELSLSLQFQIRDRIYIVIILVAVARVVAGRPCALWCDIVIYGGRFSARQAAGRATRPSLPGQSGTFSRMFNPVVALFHGIMSLSMNYSTRSFSCHRRWGLYVFYSRTFLINVLQ